MIYLDNSATTPLLSQVIETLQEALPLFGNPSSIHYEGQRAKTALIQSRREVASYLQVRPQEIFFTSGGTEALNSLIFGLTKGKRGHLISSQLEHPAVLKPIESLEGWEKTLLKGTLKGAPTLEEVREAIRPETALICLMAVNNETGVKSPWREVASLAEERGIPFIVDGVALLGKEPIGPLPRGLTGIAFSAHKIHAPKGLGLFYLKSGASLEPLILGGGQEASRRGGTENLLGILGLKRAIELLKEEPPFEQLKELQAHFEGRLLQEVPGSSINGGGERSYGVSSLSFEGVDGESLLFNLDLKGVQASHGSACSSGSLEPSRVLLEMGYPLKRVRSSIRFSFSRLNTKEEIDETVELLKAETETLRRRG